MVRSLTERNVPGRFHPLEAIRIAGNGSEGLTSFRSYFDALLACEGADYCAGSWVLGTGPVGGGFGGVSTRWCVWPGVGWGERCPERQSGRGIVSRAFAA